MFTKIDLLDRWLAILGGEVEVFGVYEQGSRVWGFADENSDRDFVVVWRSEYPNKKKRQDVIENLGGVIHQFQDISEVGKGVDMFEVGSDRLNVGHIKAVDLFDYYEGLDKLGKHYEEQLLRVGGFINGKIHYDPNGKLEEYRKGMELTDKIIESVRVKLKDNLEYELKILEIATKRESVVRLVRQMGDVLYQLHTWYYMRKKMWLMSDKWFEAFAKKYGWEDEFVSLLRELKQGMETRKIANRLFEIAKSWRFDISPKFRS